MANRRLGILAIVLLSGCPLPRPDPSLGSLGACNRNETAVCLGTCATTHAAGGSCAVNECSADRPLAICGVNLSCVPSGPDATVGTCAAATPFCNPDSPNGAPDNRCAGTMVCRRFGTDQEVAAHTACGVNLHGVFRLPDGTPARGICVLPKRDGDPCTSSWEEARASNGTPEDRLHPRCSPCAPGLQCLSGTCRRPCPNGRNDCPANVGGNAEQSYEYACSNTGNISLCTTCAPLGALCPPPTGQSDGTAGPCCTPGATCQRTCCMPVNAGCQQSSDCCAGAMCRNGQCVECGVLAGACCDDLDNTVSHPRCRVSDGQQCGANNTCESCGHLGEGSCSGNCQGRSVDAAGRCVACGALDQPPCRNSPACDGALVAWNNTCLACGGGGMPACGDGTCQSGLHLNWSDAARANLCDGRCGQPMSREHPFPNYACAMRYPVRDTFQFRFTCYAFTQLSVDQFNDRWHCMCVPTMAAPPMENDISDDSGTCTSTHPNPDEHPGPPDDG